MDNKETLFLIQNLTHQAINPMNGVIGTLDNLVEGTVPEYKKEQKLKQARSQLEYTVSLIRNLSYFAVYASGNKELTSTKSISTTVIPQAIIESAQFFQEQGPKSPVKVELVDRHIQNCIKGDPNLFKQVVINLIDNGVKYGRSGSVLTIKNWIQKKTNDLIVTFTGESESFSSDDKIFDIGVRSKCAIDRTSSGSGLGLHICKLIIENVFDGVIDASHSSSGVTTFEIRIPNGFVK
ncbi:HAMP domain-containing sensor histidine kinase [Litoribacillus peritrichatus]|uniref:Histidine kinase domain-containing protein n=1 Tax=Litoribacillus peritrichatus TaxID=718191 RepID=A0ABP7MC97_9GAMM